MCVPPQIKQYSSYEVLPGVYVNGNLTIGENSTCVWLWGGEGWGVYVITRGFLCTVADNGGVKASYYAYLNSTATPNHALFFVAYAQGWCSVATPGTHTHTPNPRGCSVRRPTSCACVPSQRR